jgi:hypothetical protein
LSRSIIEVV